MLPLMTNVREAYRNGRDDEQNFIQNLSLFLCTFLRQHGQLIDKNAQLHDVLREVCLSVCLSVCHLFDFHKSRMLFSNLSFTKLCQLTLGLCLSLCPVHSWFYLSPIRYIQISFDWLVGVVSVDWDWGKFTAGTVKGPVLTGRGDWSHHSNFALQISAKLLLQIDTLQPRIKHWPHTNFLPPKETVRSDAT